MRPTLPKGIAEQIPNVKDKKSIATINSLIASRINLNSPTKTEIDSNPNKMRMTLLHMELQG